MNNWKKIFPNLYNNFNGFLIGLTTEIIGHLDHSTCPKPYFHVYGGLNFKTYINSSRDEYDNSEKQKNIFQLTEALISKSISADCDCGFCYDKEEFSTEFHAEVVQFAAQLVTLLEDDYCGTQHFTLTDNQKIKAGFINDYQSIVHIMLQSNITFLEAEKQLLFWHNAIPEHLLQLAVLTFRLEYIKSTLKNSIS